MYRCEEPAAESMAEDEAVFLEDCFPAKNLGGSQGHRRTLPKAELLPYFKPGA